MNDDLLGFPLNHKSSTHSVSPNELLERHLRELLDVLIPVAQDREVRVDAYKLLSDRQTLQFLDSHRNEKGESSDPLELYEPRIGYIRRLLESLLDVVELEADGRPVRVDGFRLKDPQHWLSAGGGANDILAHAASRCNLQCRFCYNAGTPSILSPKPNKPSIEYHHIEQRIQHYVPNGKLNIFPDMGSPKEILAHPHINDILRQLRAKTNELFRIPTNGAALKPAMISALAEVKPVYLDVSVNSASPERRKWLMNDTAPEVAIGSLALLREQRIPFSVVIVPWPFPSRDEMLEDLRQTVIYSASFDPTLIQLSLPGCVRALSEQAPFPLDEVWSELKAATAELRDRIECPLVIRPGLYEDYNSPEGPNELRVHGVMKNSPAARAGIQRGDRIIEINGLPVKNRPQARSLLTTIHQSELKEALLETERNGNMSDATVALHDYDYPYSPETATHLGIVFAFSGIPQEWIAQIKDIVAMRGARNVLMLSSRLVRPTLEKLLARNGCFSGARIHVRVPRNEFFGGNIFMGDLMVVEDFIRAAKKFMETEKIQPDLILIPSSPFHLSRWGRDLTGRVYLEIERALHIPVSLVECEPIFD